MTAGSVVPAAPGRVAPGALVVFLGVQIAQVMSSLDGTIVATALPEITDDVGGFSRVTWVVTAYTLAGVASMPIYGKLGDLYGRKKMLLGAIALFLTASAACGAARSMDQLLVARFCQGLGGGGLGTLSMAAIADIVPARQLGRWLGYQGFVYAVASVAGPLVGGLFVDHLSWRWAFYINLPVGLVAATIIAVGMKLPYRRVAHSIDWLGSATLTTSLALVVLIATLGGQDVPWASPGMVALVLGAIALVSLFLRQERRAPEPVLPLRIVRDPVMRICVGVNFASGLLLWCGIFFVPMFVQEVRGLTPTRAGLTLMPLMFGAALGTLVSGRWVERTGRYRVWPLLGSLVMLVGISLLATLGADTSIALVGLFALLLGTGVGFVMQPSLLAAQNSAPTRDLGTATSTALLFRSLGNTIGIPIFGGILNAGLAGRVHDASAFADTLPTIFLAAVPVAVVSTIVATRLPERPLREEANLALVAAPSLADG